MSKMCVCVCVCLYIYIYIIPVTLARRGMGSGIDNQKILEGTWMSGQGRRRARPHRRASLKRRSCHENAENRYRLNLAGVVSSEPKQEARGKRWTK